MARRLSGAGALAVFAITVAAFVVAWIADSSTAQLGVLLAAGVLAAVGVAVGVRINQITDRRPWLLVVLGLGLLTELNAAYFLTDLVPGGWSEPPAWLIAAPQIGGYLMLLTASLMVVLRHAPHDGSGIIDAAVWGIAVAAPAWEFGFRPHLPPALYGTASQAVVLIQLLVLLGICGALLRTARTSGPDQVTLRLLFAALACTLAGITVEHVVPATMSVSESGSSLCFTIGYLALGGAALHPSARTLTRAHQRGSQPAPTVQLGLLGTGMIIIPVTGLVAWLAGQSPDPLLLTVAPLFTVPLVLVRIGRLLRQRMHDQETLTYQASHDELTGLINRRRLFTVMSESIARHVDGEIGDLAVIYCDLNDFKPINDRYGHEAGDEVLRATSRRIVGALRQGDVVARIGGDEFLAFCPGADAATADALRRRIQDAAAEPVTWQDRRFAITVAVGSTVWSEGRPVAPDDLLAAADAEMYAEKRARRQSATR